MSESVVNSFGEKVSLKDLPEPTMRWTERRKATVAALVQADLVAAAEILQRYDMSQEELDSWLNQSEEERPEGLRIRA